MKHLKCIEKFIQGKAVFCGIDVHAKHWDLCYFSDGEVLERLVIPGMFDRLKGHTESVYKGAGSVHFVYEAGFSGFWLYRRLTAMGYKCTVTPPSRIPSIDNKIKTDKRDAEKLARFLAGGLLRNVYVPPPSVEMDRQVLRLLRGHKKKLTRVKNQINAVLRLYGLSWDKTSGCRWTKRHVSWLEGLVFDGEAIRLVLDQHLDEYRFLRSQISVLTKRIRQLSKSSAYQRRFGYLISCKGVGLITAMTFLLELWDMTRFPSTIKFCGYLGATPSQHSSGEHVRVDNTPHGETSLLHKLIDNAGSAIRQHPPLLDRHYRLLPKSTTGEKAIVVVVPPFLILRRRRILEDKPHIIVGG